MNEEEIQNKKKELREQIDQLEKQRMEFLVTQDKAFKCKKCNQITMKDRNSDEKEKEQLCWIHLEEKKCNKKREEYLEKFKDAKLVDIDLKNHWGEIEELILEKDGKRYIFNADHDEERSWIEYRETIYGIVGDVIE
ncbi:unnamed protein product [marine sediment metagenome]|uniref:Uncharacterized protein n=1 Tax=marine sediment metagenome TaxID=412755 RepID=X0TLM8_9ZZZZ